MGIVSRDHLPPGAPTLLTVRSAAHSGFDRVVLEFDGAFLPAYHIEYIDRPVRECGSGEVVPIAGDGWLLIRLSPSNAHTPEGAPTVRERNRMLDYPNLRQARLICDFEAQVEWVLGVSSPNAYRVLELEAPTRLVVDVRTGRT